MKLVKYTTTGSKSSITVADEVFGATPNQQILAQAVRVYLSNQRQNTGAAQTRSDVARTKKKWFKQKGTGNARHGARSSNIFVGGGAVFGPTADQNWSKKLSKQLKKKALVSALSAQQANIVVSDAVEKLDGKTKSGMTALQQAGVNQQGTKVLVVLGDNNPVILRSLRNLANVEVTQAQRVSTYQILKADQIVATTAAIKQLEEKATK